MKLPLAVEASVADDLRTWLASELEQLEATSTNQFAHHVVTILLHEDLDIEDEPLSSNDDFLKDIFNIKTTKSREKRKKAAVQFLRNAVTCSETADAAIYSVVEELMQKIDATKRKMQCEQTPKRSLLVPLEVNVESPSKKNATKRSIVPDAQRYREAFPSLSDEEPVCKGAAVSAVPSASWNKSPGHGKENQKKKVRRKIGSRCTVLFRSAEEASLCDIVTEMAASVLDDSSLTPKEAMEVWAPSPTSSFPPAVTHRFCWRSAFSKTSLMTRPFAPSMAPLNLPGASMSRNPRKHIVVVLSDKEHTIHPECVHADGLSHFERMGFLSIPNEARRTAREQRRKVIQAPMEPLSADMEVAYYLCPDVRVDDSIQASDHINADLQTPGAVCQGEEIDNAASFPTHYGSYWQELINQGTISLYPPFVAQQEDEEGCSQTPDARREENSYSVDDDDDYDEDDCDSEPRGAEMHLSPKNHSENISAVAKYLSSLVDVASKEKVLDELQLQNFTRLQKTLDELEGHLKVAEQYERMRTCVKPAGSGWCQQDWQVLKEEVRSIKLTAQEKVEKSIAWDSPWYCTEWSDINQDILTGMMGRKVQTPNPFLPPQLASCVTSEHSQFLQSAFVNNYFSCPRTDVYSQVWNEKTDEIQRERESVGNILAEPEALEAKVQYVPGQTCSSWLEGDCKAGLLCRYSHPSL